MIKSLVVHNFIILRNRLSFLDVKKLFLEKMNKLFDNRNDIQSESEFLSLQVELNIWQTTLWTHVAPPLHVKIFPN